MRSIYRTNNHEVIKDRPNLILSETRLPTIGHTIRSNTSHEVITERPDIYLPDRPGQTTRINPTREVITERLRTHILIRD